MDMNGIGEPVYVWKKPDIGKVCPVSAPQTSDEFNDQSLSFQWSWNHNPVSEAWSLSSNPGFIALNGLPAGNFLKAKNTLTQKIMGDEGEATTLLLTTEMGNGQKAGLCVMGKQYNLIGIEKVNGKLTLFVNINGKNSTQAFKSSKVYLKVKVTTKEGGNQFFYSTDNKTFQPSGDTFSASNGYWKGPKTGLFSYNETGEGGKALFNWFHYLYDGPKSE
jgi:beta-xylosidase